MGTKRGAVLFLCFAVFAAAEKQNLIFQLGDVVLENVTKDYGLYRITCTFGAEAYDANQDGWTDLLISNHGLVPRVFINQQGKSFREAPEFLPLQGADRHAPAMADFDNDGDQDLYFNRGAHNGTGVGPKEFFMNPGHGKPFVRVSKPELEDPLGRGRTSVWFDYDQDGYVDLFNSYKYRSDAPNRLYKNNGDGTFTDVSAQTGLMQTLDSEGGAVAVDIDNDRDMDLVVSDTDSHPHLFINQGNGTFNDEATTRGFPKDLRTWEIGRAHV